MNLAKLFSLIVTFRQVKSECLDKRCQKILLDVHQDAVENTEFIGHVFQNSVSLTPVQCYILCMQDCWCLSINYKERNEGMKLCELNEGNHFTDKSSLKRSPGSIYYLLRREESSKTFSGSAPCVGEVPCINHCCKNNPCLNGGTCTEICEPTTIRYNCSCEVAFVGRHCEKPMRSCQDYKAAGSNMSGLYTVIGDSSRTFQVFCDFDSEPGFAWNLIESFTLANKHLFQNDIVFYEDYYPDSNAVNGDAPNWQAYLIKRPSLLWLRDQSTHWRATCRYNTDGNVYTDYIRASLEDFDIIGDVPSEKSACRKYELVNIRGNECVNCTAATWYLKGYFPLHIDSSIRHGCVFYGSLTDGAVSSEDNFGFYYNTNTKFRCTSSASDTTQLWIGGK